MRRAASFIRLMLVSVPLLSVSFAVGQTSFASAQDPKRQFAEIDASLLGAANSAIEATSTPAPQLKTNPPVHAPQVQMPAASASLPTVSQRTSQRIDAFRPLVLPILTKEGVPGQLAAVIQVESGGNPLALSDKGALGLWQLMPETARRYGLRVDSHLDERLDVEKSTTTAARYLRDLYVHFGDWPLALAAYNTGEQNLQRAIDRARSRDFATLSSLGYLPVETRNYVPAVLAAMGTQVPSVPAHSQNARPVRFVYATFEQPGQ